MFRRVNSLFTQTPPTPNASEPKKIDEPSERSELFGVRRTARNFFHNLTSSDSASPSESPHQNVLPSRLPPVNSDLLGIMDERRKERSQRDPLIDANSESAPSSIAPRRRRKDLQVNLSSESSPQSPGLQKQRTLRRMAGDWGAASEYLRKFDDQQSPSSMENSPQIAKAQERNKGIPQKQETPESSPSSETSPSSNYSAPLSDEQKREFIAEMRDRNFILSEEDLSDATQLTLGIYRAFLTPEEDDSYVVREKTAENVNVTPPTDLGEITLLPTHCIFTTLYTAVVSTKERIAEEEVVVPLEVSPETFSYTDSTGDKGGHGGSKTARIEYNGQTYYLYLKPKQEAEVRGYGLIAISDNHQEEQYRTSQFMAGTYGVVAIDGQEYFVMEDLCAENNDALVDAKLAYLIEGLYAIADPDEIATSGRKKHGLDYVLMEKGAKRAPGFMVSVHSNKALRFLHYKHSKEVLKETLAQHYDINQLTQLSERLVRLAKCVAVGDLAYIGTSVLFLRNNFSFIDPAHIQVDPSKRNHYPQDSRIFYGTQDNFEKRKAANVKSIIAIEEAIQELIEEKKYEKERADWEAPLNPADDWEF